MALETYADREHTASGSIVMTRAGSQIEDYDAMADRVVRMVKEGKVLTHLNEDASLKSETICIHGDTPGFASGPEDQRGIKEERDSGQTD